MIVEGSQMKAELSDLTGKVLCLQSGSTNVVIHVKSMP